MSRYRHSTTTRAVLRSLVPVICPPQAEPLADPILDAMALMFAASPRVLQHGLVAGVLAYDLGAVPRHLRRAQSLSAPAADRYFAWWEHGPTPFHVQLARAINQLMSLACYEQPAMMASIGYHPAAWIEEVTRNRLRVFRDEIRDQTVQILAADPLRPGIRIHPPKERA